MDSDKYSQILVKLVSITADFEIYVPLCKRQGTS